MQKKLVPEGWLHGQDQFLTDMINLVFLYKKLSAEKGSLPPYILEHFGPPFIRLASFAIDPKPKSIMKSWGISSPIEIMHREMRDLARKVGKIFEQGAINSGVLQPNTCPFAAMGAITKSTRFTVKVGERELNVYGKDGKKGVLIGHAGHSILGRINDRDRETLEKRIGAGTSAWESLNDVTRNLDFGLPPGHKLADYGLELNIGPCIRSMNDSMIHFKALYTFLWIESAKSRAPLSPEFLAWCGDRPVDKFSIDTPQEAAIVLHTLANGHDGRSFYQANARNFIELSKKLFECANMDEAQPLLQTEENRRVFAQGATKEKLFESVTFSALYNLSQGKSGEVHVPEMPIASMRRSL